MNRTMLSVLCILATVAVLGGGASVSRAQAGDGKLPATNGAFYAISVRNMDEAIVWYTRHLGYKVEWQVGNDQRKGALLSRPGSVLELGEFVGAIAREEVRPGLESHEVFGIFKLGFTTASLESTFAVLEGEGVEIFFPIVTASDGRRTFGIKDLEGNIIQFFGT
jgi:catechol 2,3-dioxygenase-like lactoylglutathione lyase family enzyme